MPWFPDFVSAVELARRQTRGAGQADPVAEYFSVLQSGATSELESVWPGKVVIFDPRAGEVRGHHHLRRFVHDNEEFWANRQASIETVASTSVGRRAVVELLARVKDFAGREVAWPIAVVAESPDDLSVVFRTYCSQWPVDGLRPLRPPILPKGDAHPGDVVARFLEALRAGDAEGILATFEADGYLREPIGHDPVHRGGTALGSYFARALGAGGGVHLEGCALTDDGTRCVLEYNCVHWGNDDLPPQAGVGIYERGPDGLLAAVRIYDDIEAPASA
jgi:hypothetical protein